jgi:hypothetical protein
MNASNARRPTRRALEVRRGDDTDPPRRRVLDDFRPDAPEYARAVGYCVGMDAATPPRGGSSRAPLWRERTLGRT